MSAGALVLSPWPKLRSCGRAGLAPELVLEAHRLYEQGTSVKAIGLLTGRDGGTMREIFRAHGLRVRLDPAESARCRLRKRNADGTLKSNPLLPLAEIERLIDAAPTMKVPAELKTMWRKLSVEQRGRYALRMKRRLMPEKLMPAGPCSRNVTRFDYGSEEAWKIVRASNAGLPSRKWKKRIMPCSEGLIWDGRLWFWAGADTGCIEGVAWTPEKGRRQLHHAVWQKANGRPVPDGCVIRFRDGNVLNMQPGNLALASRNDLARENQASHQMQKSREIAAALLRLAQKKEKGKTKHENESRRRTRRAA